VYIWVANKVQLSAEDHDRSKHFGVITDCVEKYNFNISAIVGFVVRIIKIQFITIMKTPTCFGTSLPSSGSYYNKAVKAKHFSPGTTVIFKFLRF
jgi:hypothetical protein